MVRSCSLPNGLGYDTVDVTDVLLRSGTLLMNCVVSPSAVDDAREEAMYPFVEDQSLTQSFKSALSA